MGLDVSAYERIRGVACSRRRLEYCGHLDYFALEGFEARLDGRPPGCCRTSGRTLHFPCGPYSTYNAWRNTLARFAHGVSASRVWRRPGAYAGRPFVPLIDFADNEGCIGPDTSARLAADFRGAADAAAAWASGDGLAALLGRPSRPGDRVVDAERFLSLYGMFRSAFSLAAGRGAVRFH